MSLKIAILDDEKHACETLVWQLQQVSIPHEVVGVFQKPSEALKVLSANVPELIFLDIEMPGLNGFQFLEKLNQAEVHIVFTTAYDEFALKAFRVNAVDYLIKPVDLSELEAALQRVEKQRSIYRPELLRQLFSDINQKKAGASKIGVPSVHGIDFVNCDEIVYCQGESNYCRIYLSSGRKILASKTLKEVEEMLPAALFLRVHHSYIANLSRVVSYVNHEGGALVMDNEVKLKVSRARKKEVLDRLKGGE